MGGGYPCCCPGYYGRRGLLLPSGSGPPQPSGSLLAPSGSGYGFRAGPPCQCCATGHLPGGGYLFDVSAIAEEAFPALSPSRCLALNRAWVCDQHYCYLTNCIVHSALITIGTVGLWTYYAQARITVSCNIPGFTNYRGDVYAIAQPTFLGPPTTSLCGAVCGGGALDALVFTLDLAGNNCAQPAGDAMTYWTKCIPCDASAPPAATLAALAA